MELLTQTAIKKMGFDNFVSTYNLSAKRHPKHNNLVCLCYDQLKTPKNNTTNECRSLVINLDNLDVVSYPFYRFGDGDNKTKINFDKAEFVNKDDGSLIHTYVYDGVLYAASKTLASADGKFKQLDGSISDKTISEYFFENCDITVEENLNKTIMWEFRYPEAGIVNCDKPSVRKIGERCLKTLKESFVIYDKMTFNNFEELNTYLNNLDPTVSEGLICITGDIDNGNIVRYKYKSPQFELIANLNCYDNSNHSDDKKLEIQRLNRKWLKQIRSVNTHHSFLNKSKYSKFKELYNEIDIQYKNAYTKLENAINALPSNPQHYEINNLKLDKETTKFLFQHFKSGVSIYDYLLKNF